MAVQYMKPGVVMRCEPIEGPDENGFRTFRPGEITITFPAKGLNPEVDEVAQLTMEFVRRELMSRGLA